MSGKQAGKLALFTILILSWGTAFAAVKVGLENAPPLLFSGIRTFIGGFIILFFAIRFGGPLAFRKNWPVYLFAAGCSVFLFFGLQTLSVSLIPSGITAVLVYLQPVLVSCLAWIWLNEPLSRMKISGLLLGFIGVCVISINSLLVAVSLPGILFGIAAAVCWAVGTVFFKRVQEQVSIYWMITMQFLMGGIGLIGLGLWLESWSSIQWTVSFWGSLLYSAVFGISIAWVIYLDLMKKGEVSRVSVSLFIVPIISVLTGIWYLHESATLSLGLGTALVALGIYLVNVPGRKCQHVHSSQ